MSTSKILRGKEAEKVALTYLQKEGYRILQTNYRTKQAEIDIIALDNQTLVVVEVKSGKRGSLPPECRVTMQKRKRILTALKIFLYQRKLWHLPVRFEVVSVIMPGKEIQHLREEFFDF